MGILCNYPDVFCGFLNADPVTFLKDDEDNDTLLSITPKVIHYNNNWSEGQNHSLGNGCGLLSPGDYASVEFNAEYDGFTEVMEFTVPVTPSAPGESHTLKFALADVKDAIWDTGVFISSLEFVVCEGADSDEDGRPDSCDNCPSVANADQVDNDHDGFGDACDICPYEPNPGQDTTDCDANSTPDECEIWRDSMLDKCPEPDGILDVCQELFYACTTGACLDISERPFWPDSDNDCDVDMVDFAFWQECATYNNEFGHTMSWHVQNTPSYDPLCALLDRDCDDDIDLVDLTEFLSHSAGPGVNVSPACGGTGYPAPPPPPPADTDEDGVYDSVDNCPFVANAQQEDADSDGVGDACDACPGYDDTLDMDADGVPDDCDSDRDGDGIANAEDSCPDYYDPYEFDLDEDGIGDMCDPDMDDDGILEDGDGDGERWLYTCIGGNTVDCDDNCGMDYNPLQEDWDGDGVGNACDADPGEPPEGEGLLGGEMQMMSMMSERVDSMESSTNESIVCTGVMGYLVEHGTGATEVTLPAGGGTVVVDLVICNDEPLDLWEGRIGTDAANVVSIDTTGWTDKANLLWWSGLSEVKPASTYNCDANYWMVFNENGQTITHSWVPGAHGIERLLEPETNASVAFYYPSGVAGPINIAAGSAFATEYPIGGPASRTIPAGSTTTMATLTLQVNASTGEYHLNVVDGQYANYAVSTEYAPMQAGAPLTLHVGE